MFYPRLTWDITVLKAIYLIISDTRNKMNSNIKISVTYSQPATESSSTPWLLLLMAFFLGEEIDLLTLEIKRCSYTILSNSFIVIDFMRCIYRRLKPRNQSE